jgi:apolipoprotein N-acyltransferase
MLRAARDSLANFFALIIAAILFAASFPNLVFQNGLPLLAWIAYIPVFWVARRTSFALSFFWGALYGYAAYGLFNYWLSVFHPLAGLIVGSIYLVYLALLFPLLHLAVVVFPRRGYVVQWLVWMAFEYLRCQGFLAYSYGVTGYSQWNVLPVIQIADITGVWGVSALVVFPSAVLAAAISETRLRRDAQEMSEKNILPRLRTKGRARSITEENTKIIMKTPCNSKLSTGQQYSVVNSYLLDTSSVIAFFRREWLPALIWLLLLIASLVYGFASPIDYTGAKTVKVALIQHNTDPWLPARAPTAAQELEEFRNDFRILCRLSNEALTANPDTDFVVWSETAFVPRIYWHMNYRDDINSWALVKELFDYLEGKNVPFVIGNDDARRDPSINPVWDHRIDYNAVMLFERSQIKTIYRKLHLVPFTENFPYEKQLPWIYNALINADTHFWEKGSEATVFEAAGVRFSTPICFEDTFGYLSRSFVLNGAELIVNLSNDAWSASVPAQMQHLSMAVFRAVENRRSMVRSTASGQTCAVDPNGRILAMAEPFTESYLNAEVPVVTPLSLYTRFGDYLGVIFTWAAFLVLIIGSTLYIIQQRSKPV